MQSREKKPDREELKEFMKLLKQELEAKK